MKLIKTFNVQEETIILPLFQVAGLQHHVEARDDTNLIIRNGDLAKDFIDLIDQLNVKGNELPAQYENNIWHDKMPGEGYIFGGNNTSFTVNSDCVIVNRITRTLRIKDNGDIAKINLDKIK